MYFFSIGKIISLFINLLNYFNLFFSIRILVILFHCSISILVYFNVFFPGMWSLEIFCSTLCSQFPKFNVFFSIGKIIKLFNIYFGLIQCVFSVLEIPTVGHLECLEQSIQFNDYKLKTTKNESDVAQVIVHFTPLKIARNSRYRAWCESFSRTTQHIYINEENSCLGSERVHKIQYKLNHVYSPSFPLLHDSSIPSVGTNGCDNSKKMKLSHDQNHQKLSFADSGHISAYHCTDNHIKAMTLLTYHIRPHSRIESG